jgi:hypothetical protein
LIGNLSREDLCLRLQELGEFGPSVMAVVAAGAWKVQLVPAGGGDNNLLWAAWDDEASGRQVAHLVLLRRKLAKALLLWSTQNGDRYGTIIETVPTWDFGIRPVLLFRYQMGAAYVRAELYGIGANQVPTRLGEIEGSLIELLDINGMDGLRVFDTAESGDPPTCYRWDAPVRRLVQQSCSGVGVDKHS